MEWLNYHHLYYFWLVAREGGLVPAARQLRVSHTTVSTQIHALEDRLGEKLFTKVGRKLVLTEMGRVVQRYAEEIFTLGREMQDTVAGRKTGQPLRLDVGIVDAVPKLVVRRLLEPALALSEPIRIVCRESTQERLLAELALHTLDLVISDTPVPVGSNVRAYHHLLGETSITIFGTKALAAATKARFPRSLDGAPMLLPLEGLALRRTLNHWMERIGVRPRIIGEFEDSALMEVFGSDGLGLFAGPTAVEREITEQRGVHVVGRIAEAKERFYAISAERRLKHPAVVAMQSGARDQLFV